MFNWDDHVGRDPLCCASTGRSIAPGETYVCALLHDAGRFVRTTHTEEAWTGELAAAAVAHWRRRRPEEEEAQGPRLVDHRVLLEIFHQLRDSTERTQQCLLWIITLTLVRARKLRYVDLAHEEEGSALLVREVGSKRRAGWRIQDPALSPEDTERLQEDVARLFEVGVTAEVEEADDAGEAVGDPDPDPDPEEGPEISEAEEAG